MNLYKAQYFPNIAYIKVRRKMPSLLISAVKRKRLYFLTRYFLLMQPYMLLLLPSLVFCC